MTTSKYQRRRLHDAKRRAASARLDQAIEGLRKFSDDMDAAYGDEGSVVTVDGVPVSIGKTVAQAVLQRRIPEADAPMWMAKLDHDYESGSEELLAKAPGSVPPPVERPRSSSAPFTEEMYERYARATGVMKPYENLPGRSWERGR